MHLQSLAQAELRAVEGGRRAGDGGLACTAWGAIIGFVIGGGAGGLIGGAIGFLIDGIRSLF